jgi:hypothetical protein
MKIFVFLPIKDEIDIIHEFLDVTIHWASKIFILDNGSTDGTWEAVNERANAQIVPYKQSHEVFSQRFRGELFRAFRHQALENDWWCKADVDEFYLEDPRVFLSRVKWPFHNVFKESLEYVISQEDIDEFQFSGRFRENINNIRYLKPFTWGEMRFFRERRQVHWPEDSWYARGIGLPYPKTILCAHYQLRSPTQAKVRFENRIKVKQNSHEGRFKHVRGEHWRDQLEKRNNLVLDDGPVSWTNLSIKNKRPKFFSTLLASLYRRINTWNRK